MFILVFLRLYFNRVDCRETFDKLLHCEGERVIFKAGDFRRSTVIGALVQIAVGTVSLRP